MVIGEREPRKGDPPASGDLTAEHSGQDVLEQHHVSGEPQSTREIRGGVPLEASEHQTVEIHRGGAQERRGLGLATERAVDQGRADELRDVVQQCWNEGQVQLALELQAQLIERSPASERNIGRLAKRGGVDRKRSCLTKSRPVLLQAQPHGVSVAHGESRMVRFDGIDANPAREPQLAMPPSPDSDRTVPGANGRAAGAREQRSDLHPGIESRVERDSKPLRQNVVAENVSKSQPLNRAADPKRVGASEPHTQLVEMDHPTAHVTLHVKLVAFEREADP